MTELQGVPRRDFFLCDCPSLLTHLREKSKEGGDLVFKTTGTVTVRLTQHLMTAESFFVVEMFIKDESESSNDCEGWGVYYRV